VSRGKIKGSSRGLGKRPPVEEGCSIFKGRGGLETTHATRKGQLQDGKGRIKRDQKLVVHRKNSRKVGGGEQGIRTREDRTGQLLYGYDKNLQTELALCLFA